MAQHLARLVFSDDELNQLERADDKRRAFLNGWTRKEAYIKALGAGVTEPLRHFSVSLGERAEILATSAGGGSVSDWTLVELVPWIGDSYQKSDHYPCTCCVRMPKRRILSRISSAVFVHRKGLPFSLCASTYARIASRS